MLKLGYKKDCAECNLSQLNWDRGTAKGMSKTISNLSASRCVIIFEINLTHS